MTVSPFDFGEREHDLPDRILSCPLFHDRAHGVVDPADPLILPALLHQLIPLVAQGPERLEHAFRVTEPRYFIRELIRT